MRCYIRRSRYVVKRGSPKLQLCTNEFITFQYFPSNIMKYSQMKYFHEIFMKYSWNIQEIFVKYSQMKYSQIYEFCQKHFELEKEILLGILPGKVSDPSRSLRDRTHQKSQDFPTKIFWTRSTKNIWKIYWKKKWEVSVTEHTKSLKIFLQKVDIQPHRVLWKVIFIW